MFIQECWINATEGHSMGETDAYEPFTHDHGELFRSLQKEYGRCISCIYVAGQDTARDKSLKVGWVFQKRMEYDDTHARYLLETWVTLYDKLDTVTREHHYHALG